MNRALTGRYVPGTGVLHRLHPTMKLCCFFLLAAAVLLTDTWQGYLLMAGVTAGLIALSGVGLRLAAGSLARLWLFLLVIFWMNALFFESETVVWRFWIFRLSIEGLMQGAHVVCRLVLLLLLANLLTVTTPPMRITGAIETLLSPLRLIGVPTAEISMILGAAMQFIPTLAEETDLLRKAQTARGAQIDSKRLRDRAAGLIGLIVPIFVAAFRRADELATAMEARGYRRSRQSRRRRREPLRCIDWIGCLLASALCIVQIFGG